MTGLYVMQLAVGGLLVLVSLAFLRECVLSIHDYFLERRRAAAEAGLAQFAPEVEWWEPPYIETCSQRFEPLVVDPRAAGHLIAEAPEPMFLERFVVSFNGWEPWCVGSTVAAAYEAMRFCEVDFARNVQLVQLRVIRPGDPRDASVSASEFQIHMTAPDGCEVILPAAIPMQPGDLVRIDVQSFDDAPALVQGFFIGRVLP